MVNTVGSYKTIHWHKKWIPIKEALILNTHQKDVIIGSLLGDGTMRIGKGAINANFKVEHGLHQKEYVMWKHNILEPFVFTKPKISYRKQENGERYKKSWWFRTIRHPILTEIYRQFYTGENYRTGRKMIPQSIANDLSPVALAIWIMDDGSYSRQRIDISTYSFKLEDILLLQKRIGDVYNVSFNFYRDRNKGYRMYCNQKNTKNLIKIIRPHIIPSMKYKIGLVTP